MIYVRDFIELLQSIGPDRRLAVELEGFHSGANGPHCTFRDSALPRITQDAEGAVVLRFQGGESLQAE